MDGQGYVSLSVIANFKRIKTLTEDSMTLDTLRYVCQQVKSVEYLPGADGDDRLRRRENWRDFVLPVEDRFESARNDGPVQTSEQYHQLLQHEQGAPLDPAIGLGPLRSPPINASATNGGFHANSPVSYLPGAPADGQLTNGPFVSPFEDAPHENARRTSIPSSYAQAPEAMIRSPQTHAPINLANIVNGHHRQMSRSDIEENIFPDENIPNINIRMRPHNFAGPGEVPLPSIARIASQESTGGLKEASDSTLGQSRTASLRGGAGNPHQYVASSSPFEYGAN